MVQSFVKEKVLITGGAGFIGAALANAMMDDYDVIALDSLVTGSWSRLQPGITKVERDLMSFTLEELTTFLSQFDSIVHLAAVKLHNESNGLDSILDNNVTATSQLFDAAGRAGVKKIIYSSSLYAYGSMGPDKSSESDLPAPKNYYGLSKLYGEQVLSVAASIYGFQALTLRFYFIYGPNQFAEGGYKSVIIKNLEKSLRGEPIEIVGTGDQRLDYVYIGDCVTIIKKLMDKQATGLVNISSGTTFSINEVVKEMMVVTKNTNAIQLPSDWTEGSVRGGSNQKLLKMIGPFNFTPLSDGIDATWQFLRESND